jgi:hypothetical protein
MSFETDAAHTLLSLDHAEKPIRLPSQARHDQNEIKSILLDSGELKRIHLSSVKLDFSLHLGQTLHRPVRPIFCNHAKCTDNSKSIGVDQLLNQRSANAFVLHGTNLVYVVTFSEKVYTELHELAQAETGLSISYPIDNNVIEGAKLVGNSDQMQKSESPV